MADVKICDRCGKQINVGMNRRLILTTFTWNGLLVGRCYTESKEDLCPDCVDELKKFFNGEATDAVVKE
jgi:hypothetical protein